MPSLPAKNDRTIQHILEKCNEYPWVHLTFEQVREAVMVYSYGGKKAAKAILGPGGYAAFKEIIGDILKELEVI